MQQRPPGQPGRSRAAPRRADNRCVGFILMKVSSCSQMRERRRSTTTITPENHSSGEMRLIADQADDDHRDDHRDHEGAGGDEDLQQAGTGARKLARKKTSSGPIVDQQRRRRPAVLVSASLIRRQSGDGAGDGARIERAQVVDCLRRRRWRGSAGRISRPRRPARRRARCRRAWS